MCETTDNRLFIDEFAKCKATLNDKRIKEFFTRFDRNCDGCLDKDEFRGLLLALFDGEVEAIDKALDYIFSTLDRNKNGLIDEREFRDAWFMWLNQILDPVSALIVVDVQNDFISGTLSLSHCPSKHNGAEVVKPINVMTSPSSRPDYVVYTYDWHPANHISFVENVAVRKLSQKSPLQNPSKAQVLDQAIFETQHGDMEQILWPAHCIQGTLGADLHPDLMVVPDGFKIYKGTKPDVDSYSAFFDNNRISKTELEDMLTKRQVTDLYICGLASDVCVGFTAKHALELGFRVCYVQDACRGVDTDQIERVEKELTAAGAVIVMSHEVPDLVKAKKRPLQLGIRACDRMRAVLENLSGTKSS